MILMHKDIEVARVKKIANVYTIQDIYKKDRMPVGTYSDYRQLIDRKFQNWMTMRAIPDTRQNKKAIEDALGTSVSDAVLKGMRVSLTDAYWLKEENINLKWEDINFHRNGFDQTFARVVLEKENHKILDFHTPDLTTDGALEKAWVIMDRIPSLVKYGNYGKNGNGFHLLSANEVVASQVADIMEVCHAEYFPIQIENTGEIACICPCFIRDENTEFINLQQLISSKQGMTSTRSYEMLCNMGYQKNVDQMILFDYLLHNTDRHEKNLGILRKADTLEFFAFAPLFDNGSCLGWNYDPNILDQDETKPFRKTRRDQLSLIKEPMDLIPEKNKIREIVKDTYEAFRIPEKNYQIAVSDLNKTYLNLEKQRKINRDEGLR